MMNTAGGPEFEFEEFDRLMTLSPEELEQEANKQGTAQPPAPAAGEADPAAVAGGGQPPGDGGGSGGESPDPGELDANQDWIAALPDEVQQRIKDEREQREKERRESEDRYNALHGRLAPVQRRLSELENQLRYQAHPSEPQAPAAPAIQPGQTLDSYFDSTDWKEWADTYPGDAKVMRAGLEAQDRAWGTRYTQLEQQLQHVVQRLDATAQAVQTRTSTEEVARLEEKHSDWRELNQSDDFWGWAESWRASQPKSLRSMYYDDAAWREMWNDADFAIARIDEYKAATQPPSPPAPPTPPSAPQPESTQPVAQPPRNTRLSMSVAPEVRGSPVPPAVSTEGMSNEQLFEHLWNTLP